MTIAECKPGKRMLDALAQWERYIEKDPILGEDKWHKTAPTHALSVP
jgi:hypothetical protein